MKSHLEKNQKKNKNKKIDCSQHSKGKENAQGKIICSHLHALSNFSSVNLSFYVLTCLNFITIYKVREGKSYTNGHSLDMHCQQSCIQLLSQDFQVAMTPNYHNQVLLFSLF